MTCPHCHEGRIVKHITAVEEWEVDDDGEITVLGITNQLIDDFSEYYACTECNARFQDWEDVNNNTPYNLGDLED